MWSLQSIRTAVMKEQVRIHELFHIKKFQPEYITWTSHALTWFDLKNRTELKTVFEIGVLTRDFIAYEASSKLYCSSLIWNNLSIWLCLGTSHFTCYSKIQLKKRHVSLLLLYSWELEHSNLIPKSITARVYCINNRMPYCCDTFCTLK